MATAVSIRHGRALFNSLIPTLSSLAGNLLITVVRQKHEFSSVSSWLP